MNSGPSQATSKESRLSIMRKAQWQQNNGDRDAITFGGTFIRDTAPDMKGGELFVIQGIDFEAEKRTVEVTRSKKKGVHGLDSCVFYTLTLPEKIETYRLDIDWYDPLNESWVKWEDVLSHSGETREPKDILPWERIKMVADYYGWANFGEPTYLLPSEIRYGTLRKVLEAA
jgi:hypothetical protein